MDLRDVFATNLRRLRHEKGLSQHDLAYEAEVSRSYLSQLEKGAFYASLKIIGKLAEALGVESDELLKRRERRASMPFEGVVGRSGLIIRATPAPFRKRGSSRYCGQALPHTGRTAQRLSPGEEPKVCRLPAEGNLR